MQATGVTVDDLERDAQPVAAHADGLDPFRADFRYPVSATGAHQNEVVAPLARYHLRMRAHGLGECRSRAAVLIVDHCGREPRIS